MYKELTTFKSIITILLITTISWTLGILCFKLENQNLWAALKDQVKVRMPLFNHESSEEDFTENKYLSEIELKVPANIYIETVSGNISIKKLNEKKSTRAILKIQGPKKYTFDDLKAGITAEKLNLIFKKADIELSLPASEITGEVTREIKEMQVKSKSGDINLSSNTFGMCHINSISGDVRGREINIQKLNLETISGDINLQGEIPRAVLSSISGDITLQSTKNITDLSLKSTSGNITLIVPSKSKSPAVKYKTVSGKFSSEINYQVLAAEYSDSADSKYSSNSDSSKAKIEFETVSGDILLKKF